MSESDLSLPPRSPIKIQKTVRGLEMTWDPMMGCGPARWLPAAFLMFWMFGWLAGEIFAIIAFVGCVTKMMIFPAVFLGFWLTLWSFGGYFIFRLLRNLMRPNKPERLIFEEHLLRHDPGTNPFDGVAQALSVNERRAPEGELFEIRRADVKNVRLEKGNKGRLKLKIEVSDGEVELGSFLAQADKQWLHQRLCDWWGGAERP